MADDLRILRVLADNPAAIDLLGISAVATAVADVVCADNSEPITVGLHGPWGSGKSTLLGRVERELRLRRATIVVEINPWEFDDQQDVKGTIIAMVLDELMKNADDGLKGKLGSLVKRISWTRAAAAVASGALTMTWSLKQLAEALTPRPEAGPPTTLAGFRDEFAQVLSDLEADRVVLLIDDLDRCLPSAVLATLEAVKLFLAVPKMAFVVAADQDMVREAIAVGLGESRRSVAFARDYLDKIVQVPVTVPQPTQQDAECYVALLLADRDSGGTCDLESMIVHADDRRVSGEAPYLAGLELDGLTIDHLHQAQRVVAGLAVDDAVNPRRMKRFINALAVRQHTAEASGVVLDPAVVAKLFLLEHRFPRLIRTLAELSQAERSTTLGNWEKWARDDGGEAPDEADDDLRNFLSAQPLLAAEDTEKYFVLARKLLKARFAAGLSDQAESCMRLLLSDDSAKVTRGGEEFERLAGDERESIANELAGQLASALDPNPFVQALIVMADHGGDPEIVVASIHSRRADLSPGQAFRLVKSPVEALQNLAGELRTDPAVPALTQAAISRDGGS